MLAITSSRPPQRRHLDRRHALQAVRPVAHWHVEVNSYRRSNRLLQFCSAAALCRCAATVDRPRLSLVVSPFITHPGLSAARSSSYLQDKIVYSLVIWYNEISVSWVGAKKQLRTPHQRGAVPR
jgi:hypothetical protein